MARIRAVTLRLPEDLLARLGEESARRGVTRDELVRRLLTDATTSGFEDRLAGLERRVREIVEALADTGIRVGAHSPKPDAATESESALPSPSDGGFGIDEEIVVEDGFAADPVSAEDDATGRYARRPGLGVPLAPAGDLIRHGEEIEVDLG
ncbi:MAG: ribbon-helix-helix protein, CopG family [Firmicutes bacterium]|nr:ribbon-helix-helix protein, CopG family [Bacillota bacterium]